MPYCSQCQLVHGEEHRFCQRCGQLLKGSSASMARPCARCGSFTFPGQKFCTECGLPLRAARVIQDEDEEVQERRPLFYPRRPDTVVRRRQRRPGRFISLIALVLVAVAGVYVWNHLPARTSLPAKTPSVASPQDDLRREVEKISEKIRAAHLNKDLNKWLSCYTSSYPNLGQRENQMLELWKNYDIKEVNYRITNVKPLGDHQASADIVWNIQLYDHNTHDYTLIRQSYTIILEKGQGGWRIRDSKEEAGGS